MPTILRHLHSRYLFHANSCEILKKAYWEETAKCFQQLLEGFLWGQLLDCSVHYSSFNLVLVLFRVITGVMIATSSPFSAHQTTVIVVVIRPPLWSWTMLSNTPSFSSILRQGEANLTSLGELLITSSSIVALIVFLRTQRCSKAKSSPIASELGSEWMSFPIALPKGGNQSMWLMLCIPCSIYLVKSHQFWIKLAIWQIVVDYCDLKVNYWSSFVPFQTGIFHMIFWLFLSSLSVPWIS